MNEQTLRKIMARLGSSEFRDSGDGWFMVQCPLAEWKHKKGADDTPSCAVKVNVTGASGYLCHACHARGKIPDLIRRYEALSGENLRSLAQKAEMADLADTVTDEWSEGHDSKKRTKLGRPLAEDGYIGLFTHPYTKKRSREYLERRGISRGTATRIGLGYDPEKRRIVFPVRDQKGGLYGFSGRLIVEATRRNPKIRDYAGLPKRHLILGEHEWGDPRKDQRPIVLGEGLFGYAHFIGLGVDRIARVGAILGTELTGEKLERVLGYDTPVFLFMDPDDAGDSCIYGRTDDSTGERDEASGAAYRLALHVPVYIPRWPRWRKETNHQGKKYRKGTVKSDQDQLDLAEVKRMMERAPQYVPPRELLNPDSKEK